MLQKVQYLKTVPKATFFASTMQAYIFFVETKDAICVLLSLKSARNPGHYRLFVSTGTRPGQMQKFRDCPGHSGTLGNYESPTSTKTGRSGVKPILGFVPP